MTITPISKKRIKKVVENEILSILKKNAVETVGDAVFKEMRQDFRDISQKTIMKDVVKSKK